VIDDIVVGFEHAVRERICAHELPDVFTSVPTLGEEFQLVRI
jgi:hypothetical protein